MTDRRDDDAPDEGRQPGEPVRAGHSGGEGVRILGAEEAQAALDAGTVVRRRGEGEARFGDVPPRPDPALRPAASFPRPSVDPGAGADPVSDDVSDRAASERAGAAASEGPEPEIRLDHPDETSGPVPLPHWTDPPTGEVPQILPEAEPVDITGEGDLDAWVHASGSTPRFRTGIGDWDDEHDFGPVESLKEETGVGALVDPADDDREFAAEVAARRRPGRPGRKVTAPHDTDAGPPTERTAGGDLSTRVITGLVVAAVALLCFELGRGATAVLAAAIVGLSAFELFEGLRKKGFVPATLVGLLGSITIVLAAYKRGEAAFPLLIALVTVFSLLWYLSEVVRARPVVNVAVTLLGFSYVGVLGAFAGLLLAFPHGIGLVLGVALCAIAYDVFGYFIGKQFGRTHIAPRISPNKTLEGLIAGMVASVVVAVVVVGRIHPWGDVTDALALGFTVAVMAPLGDLCESMLKRDLGVKDLGTLLPGHGGALDRFDAILFSLPAVYYLARTLDIGVL